MLITRIAKYIICSGFLLLVACQPIPDPVSPTSSTGADPIMTPPDLEAAPTQAFAPTITPTGPILPTDSIIQNQCPEISGQFAPGRASGVLVVQERVGPDLLFNLETGEKKRLDGIPVISPDGANLAYFGLDNNTFENFLVIRAVRDLTQRELPLFDGIFRMIGWHDNQRLLFRMTRDPATDPAPHLLVLFNPFTGEKKTYNRDFPDIDNEVEWDLLGPAAYDQTMSYILYAGLKDAESRTHEYVLWDDVSKTEIAAFAGSSHVNEMFNYDSEIIQLDGVSHNPPRWSPDDSRVAIIAPAPQEKMNVDEIYTITKTGEVQRLTYFANHFEKAKISDLSWSPEGKSIAFWVTLEPSLYTLPQDTYQNVRLGIVNTETLEITYYCIMGDSIGPMNGRPSAEFIGKSIPAPIWSPDGTQVVLESRYSSDKSRLILLNLQDGTAVEIGQNIEPIGWMIEEP